MIHCLFEICPALVQRNAGLAMALKHELGKLIDRLTEEQLERFAAEFSEGIDTGDLPAALEVCRRLLNQP